MPSGVFLFCVEPFSTKAIWPHNDTSNALSPSNNFFLHLKSQLHPFVSESLLIFYDKKQVRFTNARMSGIYCITYPLLNTSWEWDINTARCQSPPKNVLIRKILHFAVQANHWKDALRKWEFNLYVRLGMIML